MIGVSSDDQKTQCDFAAKMRASFPMVADPDCRIARMYDVVWPFLKLVQRVTFLIDREGVIRNVFHNELRIEHHVTSVLQAMRKLATAA